MRLRFPIAFFLILAVLLNINSIAGTPVVSILKSVAGQALFPIHWLSAEFMTTISNTGYFIQTAPILKEENQKLRAQNEELKANLLTLRALKKENLSLQQALHFNLDRRMPYLKLRRAKVIGRSDDLWDSLFVINLGRNNYVTKGLPVISSKGLVGKVIEVSERTAKVRTILDSKSSVSVKTARSGIEAVAVGGAGSRIMKLKYVSSGSKVVIGEDVVVSASSRLPDGVPVGKVVQVTGNEKDLFQEVRISPAADFSKLGIIYLVMP